MAQWSRPIAIPNQTSKTTSALALVQGRLHLVHLGASSDNLWHSVWDGTRWSDNVLVGWLSRGRVAFAQNGLMVYQSGLMEPDGSRKLNYTLLSNGLWAPGQRVPDVTTSWESPSAVMVSNNVWEVVRQVPNEYYKLSVSRYALVAGSPPSIKLIGGMVLNEQSEKTPALAVDQTGLHKVYLYRGSKDIWHSWGVVNQQIPNQFSRDVPAMASHNGVLHMTHIGSGSDTIWYSTFAGGQWTPNVPIPNHFSNKPPAMCSAPDGLHMVHKGAGSDRIWHSIYR